uniref:Uncharacterized protein n=1 Tax=viral metagenome TaxID=1070528 RepID=A0A6C0D3B8_9ZZZZ
MANLVNMTKITSTINDVPIVQWKGQTFAQITSSIQKNGKILTSKSLNKGLFFIPPPLKIYRREIASQYDNSHCNTRTSLKIDEFDRPGGSIIYATNKTGLAPSSRKGLVSTEHINLTVNASQRPSTTFATSNCTVGVDDAQNARRRVRSSGNVKRAFNPANNTSTYYTDNKQYLISRNKTFHQNQYYFIRQGVPTAKPGDSLSVSNIYSPNGEVLCPKYYVVSDCSFQYQWLNGNNYKVDISGGSYYDTAAINNILQTTMLYNGHYYLHKNYGTKTTLLNLSYNNFYNKVELLSSVASSSTFPSSTYNVGTGSQISWTTPTNATVPRIVFNSSKAANLLGFVASTSYPTTAVSSSSSNYSSNQDILSPNKPLVGPTYSSVYYKPNNPQFAQQGAVSSSSHITRRKYDSITHSSVLYRAAYGLQVANALAYGVSENGYTIKDKLGYPTKQTPMVTATGQYRKCGLTKFTHQI